MPLFKYLPQKYLEAFFRAGSLKIDTLYDYRNTEQHGTVIGDRNVGALIDDFASRSLPVDVMSASIYRRKDQ